jgi:hypothetical protein
MPKQTEKLGDWRVFKTAEAVAVHAAEWLCSVACSHLDFLCLQYHLVVRRA